MDGGRRRCGGDRTRPTTAGTLLGLVWEPIWRGSLYLRGRFAVPLPSTFRSWRRRDWSRGDVLRLAGRRSNIDAAVREPGLCRPANQLTDMIWVGLDIVVGGLIGASSFRSAACRCALRHPAAR